MEQAEQKSLNKTTRIGLCQYWADKIGVLRLNLQDRATSTGLLG